MPEPATNFERHPVLAALLDADLIDLAGARRVHQVAQSTNESVVAVVHQLALVDDTRVVEALATRFDMKRIAAADVPDAPIALDGVSAAFLRRHRILPLGWAGERLLVGVIDPESGDGLAAVSFAANCAAEPRLMSASEQKRAFDALYGASTEPAAEERAGAVVSIWADDAARMRDVADAGPAVRIVDALLERAIEQNASDIHIEPLPDRVRVRFRVDGDLVIAREEAAHLAAPIAARIKVLADMDVADRRSAQDGRTSLAAKGRPVDVRISSVPSAYGETIALRLLRRDAALLNLTTLGFGPEMLAIFEHVLSLRRGLFLITGPTGSGKTTSLYAMLERLRGQMLKILSIEDPIEYYFNDITQTQVNEDAGLTFASALRAFLRQDPDVILVGEIRDPETARIAVQAALTGHLVLATLHTVDAPGAVARLVDMGVDRYLVAATLAGIVSQRLVRRLCPECRISRAPNQSEHDLIAPLLETGAAIQVSDPVGCPRCRNSGVSGRLAAAEGFLVDDKLRDAMTDETGARLAQALNAKGYRAIASAAASLAARGEIAPAEIRALTLS
ncbi:MAG: GspE/PulE family protein [Pseudomonadota bacterium]